MPCKKRSERNMEVKVLDATKWQQHQPLCALIPLPNWSLHFANMFLEKPSLRACNTNMFGPEKTQQAMGIARLSMVTKYPLAL